MGDNRNFWLLKKSLIFQVISWELDVNFSKQLSMRFLAQIKRYFKFVLSVVKIFVRLLMNVLGSIMLKHKSGALKRE